MITRRGLLAGSAALARAVEDTEIRLPKKVRLALLGLDGHVAEITGPLKRLPDVELVAVSDADEAALARFNAGGASLKRYTDYRRMLDAERLDAVAICNNNGERAAAILACADRKLNVIAEKPFAIELSDLAKVRRAVEKGGIHISTLLPMRFDPPYLALRKLVREGSIGEVAQIAAQKSYKAGTRPAWFKRRATYGGTIAWIGIHMIDLMRWASGREFTETLSYQSRLGFPELGEMETVTASLFRLDNGGAATLRMDYFRPETAPTHGDDRLRLAGPNGVIEYQAATGVTVLLRGKPPETLNELPPAGSVFVDFIRSAYLGAQPELAPRDIWRVNEISLIARDSAEQGKPLKL